MVGGATGQILPCADSLSWQELHRYFPKSQNCAKYTEKACCANGSQAAEQGRMLRKIYGGTARSDQKSLCSNCRFATIVRGQTLDEEVVHCQSVTTRGMRVTFKVTSCTSHSDMDQPTYMQLLDDAWILKPASKKRPAGFVKHSELKADEIEVIMKELRESWHE
jgi:hypothetical protein